MSPNTKKSNLTPPSKPATTNDNGNGQNHHKYSQDTSPQLSSDSLDSRWKSLLNAIDVVKLHRSGLSKSEVAVYGSILDNLREFSRRLLTYFVNPNYFPPTGFTREYAQNLILNQIGFDLTAITNVMAQRTMYANLLHESDRVAQYYADVATKTYGLFQHDSDTKLVYGSTNSNTVQVDNFLEPRPITITYLQKMPTIRVMPYTPFALISLPYAAIGANTRNPQNSNSPDPKLLSFLSLAHEVGHLSFWKGYSKIKSAKFASFANRELRIQGFSPYLADGVEEIVADIVGGLLAGPAMAYTAIRNATLRQFDRYFAVNANYMVIPELRPNVYIELLKESSSDRSLSDLEHYWEEQVNKSFGVIGARQVQQPHRTVQVGSAAYAISYTIAEQEIRHATAKISQSFLNGNVEHKTALPDPEPDADVIEKLEENGKCSIQKILDSAEYSSLKGNEDFFKIPNIWKDGTIWAQKNTHDDYFRDVWLKRLSDEEQQQTNRTAEAGLQLTDLRYMDPKDREWFVALYAGGWVMESPGNSKGTGG